MSRSYCDDHESDDDKVVYIDNDEANINSTNNFNIKNLNKPIINKRKSLFQYRRLRDDVDNDDDIMKIKKTIDLQGIHSILNNIKETQYIEVGVENNDYADSSVTKNVKFHTANIISTKIHEEIIKKSDNFNDINSLLPISSSKYSESNHHINLINNNNHIHKIKPTIGSPMKFNNVTPHYDIAMDRPSHWNKLGNNKSSSRNNNSIKSSIKPHNNSLLVNKILTKHAMNIPNKNILKQPSNKNNIINAPLSDIDKLCFKPSWMINNKIVTNNNNNNNSDINKHNDELTEQIQEEYEDFSYDYNTNTNLSNYHNSNTYATNEISSYTPKKSNILSPNTYLTNSNTKHTIKGYSMNSTSKPSKAKPGTLKAKLFKILRELDAAETWIVNIPSKTNLSATNKNTNTNNSNNIIIDQNKSIDLQDPRNRASFYIDFEYLTKLPDQYPFQTCLLRVLDVYNKSDNNIFNNNNNNNNIFNNNNNNKINEAPAINQLKDNMIAINKEIKAFFKSNDAMISNRNLYDGMHLRIYEPSIISLSNNNSTHNINNNIDNNQANELVLLCTNCWESIS